MRTWWVVTLAVVVAAAVTVGLGIRHGLVAGASLVVIGGWARVAYWLLQGEEAKQHTRIRP